MTSRDGAQAHWVNAGRACQDVIMTLRLKPGTSWSDVYGRAVAAAPEAFADGRLRNLVAGQWASIGQPGTSVSPVDGSPIAGPPNVSLEEARQAVAFAADEHAAWGQ